MGRTTRWSNSVVVGALILQGAIGSADAQLVAVGGKAATARVEATLTIPEFFSVRQLGRPEVIAQGPDFTEFVVRVIVASNGRWDLETEAALPGVSVRTTDGAWRAGAGAHRVVWGAEATNAREYEVRIRVADGAAVTWMDEIRFVVRTASLATQTTVASH